MTKKRLSKKTKVLTACSFILIILIIIATLITNYSMRNLDASRDPRLVLHDATMQWVTDDLRSYLTVVDSASYDSAKQNTHMSKELKDQLFGSTYNKLIYMGSSTVKFMDQQYSIEDKDRLVFYFLTSITTGNTAKQVNFIVSVQNNIIYDIVAY